MCRVFSVYRSGYYRWRGHPESRRTIETRRLDARIKSIYEKSKRRYGSPKIAGELNDTGFAVSKNPDEGRRASFGHSAQVSGDHRFQAFPSGGRQPFAA